MEVPQATSRTLQSEAFYATQNVNPSDTTSSNTRIDANQEVKDTMPVRESSTNHVATCTSGSGDRTQVNPDAHMHHAHDDPFEDGYECGDEDEDEDEDSHIDHDYGAKEYWNERYRHVDSYFEWYVGYNDIRPELYAKLGIDSTATDAATELVKQSTRILVVGCGNSPLSLDMVHDGFTQLISTDYSEPVIDFMRELHPGMQWEVMDCMNLQYPNASFDIVIDKGTMDALLCGQNAFVNTKNMLDEMYRVLKPGGIGIVVSYGEPAHRTFHFGARAWRVEHSIVGDSRHMYIAMKALPAGQSVLTPKMVAEARRVGRDAVLTRTQTGPTRSTEATEVIEANPETSTANPGSTSIHSP